MQFSSIPLSSAAEIMGVNQWCVRIGLQNGTFSFGKAIRVNDTYFYHIDPYEFAEYINSTIQSDSVPTLCDTLS